MLIEKLHTACKRTALAATIAFGLAAASPTILANDSNSFVNENTEIVASNSVSEVNYAENKERNSPHNYTDNNVDDHANNN